MHNIAFKGPTDGSGPKLVKLFTNRHSFGFSDADSVPCVQQLDLTAKDLEGGEPIALKLTKVSGAWGLSGWCGKLRGVLTRRGVEWVVWQVERGVTRREVELFPSRRE